MSKLLADRPPPARHVPCFIGRAVPGGDTGRDFCNKKSCLQSAAKITSEPLTSDLNFRHPTSDTRHLPVITSPDDPALAELCGRLAELAVDLDREPHWPAQQLRLCGEYGVYEWFIDPAWGGQGWDEAQVVRGYLALAAACITTTFIITQRTGACRRIAGSQNDAIKERWLPGLASGEFFGTVGISHLTTSRRHLAKPVLTAERIQVMRGSPVPAPGAGFRLDGMAPWVTGAAAADVIVLAATVVGLSEAGHSATDEQLLVALPTKVATGGSPVESQAGRLRPLATAPGLAVAEPLPLVGVSASSTGPVHLDGVEVSDEWVIAGPMRHVMASGVGGSTGGLETSTLAVGLARAAIDFLADEATRRADLQQPAAALRTEHDQLLADLLEAAGGGPVAAGNQAAAGGSPAREPGSHRPSKESVRQRANSLVLRATQAALAAAKGSGYVIGHPAGRWCREALFFLVWSCPQPVAAANLCELAGIQD